ncbi:MAG: hypothetical protein ABII76_13695 [Pseudomonadota bacterium]
MTNPAQPSPYPASLHEWERLLTRALLRADGAVADPIRSFEITPETLAQHCGLGPEHASGAEDAFRRALKSDPYLHWSLQNGTARTPTTQVPNCMALLALSLLVDSLLDGAYEGKGEYREKLAQWLGIHRSFMNLSGISTMWVDLVAWLDERIVAGDRFRPLILPDAPRSWTHIGYTRYLSFPTKRDIALLRKLIEKKPQAAEDALTLVPLLDQLVNSSSVSFGMQVAFQDFRDALRAGAASVDHRFWRLVMRARALGGHAEAPVATLRMEFDEDGGRHYRLTVAESHDAWLPTSIGSAAGLKPLQASPNLGPAAKRGVLFFRSSGLASWTASGEPPVGVRPFHVAIADRHLGLVSGALASFEQTGTWHVTSQPVAASTLNDILKRLGLLASRMTVRTIALADGVHVGRAWLGHPRYLPVVDGTEGEIKVAEAGDGASGLICVNGALIASAPIEGDFTIGDKAGRWSRRASFVALAHVHAELDGAAYGLPQQQEWQTGAGRAAQSGASEPAWDESPYAYQDMVEAIYASARSGIAEGDLVGLVARAAGNQTWEMLRTLQESTFLDARLLERWRGRRFTLGRPTLTDIEIDGKLGALVSGALPSRLETDFRETVALHSGSAFRRLTTASLAPPVLGATGVSSAALAGALGWATAQRPALPVGSAATRLIETSVLGESYVVASKWDWAAGRFRVGSVASGAVSLLRLVHPGGRDHDIYRITGARCRSFTSRHAAILDAHQQAGRPLFRLDGGRLIRISAEGALPLEIAKALRLRTLFNGGATGDGWGYSVARADVCWLCHLLRGIIEGAAPPAATSALSYRRGRGARRPIWAAGGISA